MTGFTSPDNLPYPNDYEQPADVPAAVKALADASQVALNKKLASTFSSVALSANTGWVGTSASLLKLGRFVMATGQFTRASNIGVADNGEYTFGIVPAGWRPVANWRATGSWQVLNTGLTPDAAQIMATTIIVGTDGFMQVVSNVNGTFRAGGGDYVSASGLCWWTA